MNKSKIREKILKIRKRKNNNYSIGYKSLLKVLNEKNFKGNVFGGYYPYNYEIDPMKILKKLENKNYYLSLPKIKSNSLMDFYKWSTQDPLMVNKYGIPEPISKKIVYPDVLLVPLVAFDKEFNRIGYGGGFYDRYIYKLRKIKKIMTIGLAYSFQKVKKIPVKHYDINLDYIITEKDK